MHPNVRVARIDDAAAIQKIYAPSITESAISFEVEVPSVQEIENRISTVLKQYPWLVYEHEGKVVGFAYAGFHRTRAAYQWTTEVSLYVNEKHYGMGIGKALYQDLFSLLRKQGYHIAVAGITLPNAPSVSIHEHFGFKHVGTFKELGYKFGAWHDVGWWALELNLADLHPNQKHPKPPIAFPQL